MTGFMAVPPIVIFVPAVRLTTPVLEITGIAGLVLFIAIPVPVLIPFKVPRLAKGIPLIVLIVREEALISPKEETVVPLEMAGRLCHEVMPSPALRIPVSVSRAISPPFKTVLPQPERVFLRIWTTRADILYFGERKKLSFDAAALGRFSGLND
jgi:hypothetical protein